jgi:hypothetical protein
MKKILVAAIMLLMGLAIANPVHTESFIKLKGDLWNSGINGHVKSETKLIPGTKVDLIRDLDLEKTAMIPEVELTLNWGMNKLICSMGNAVYSGEKTLNSDVTFSGVTYIISDKISTDLSLTLGGALYERVFTPKFITEAFPSIANVEAGLLLGVKYIAAEVKLDSTLGSAKTEDGTAPIPVIGLLFKFGMLENKLNWELGAVGFKASMSDVTAEYFDAYLESKLSFIPVVPIGIGYKMSRLNISNNASDSFDLNLNMSGLYIFTQFEF